MGANNINTDTRPAHLAVVSNAAPVADLSAAIASRAQGSSTVSFGAAVTVNGVDTPQRRTALELVASRYERFEDALFSMVVATGADINAAPHIEQAILSNPGLRAQAEGAFEAAKRRATMGAVD